MISIRPFRNTDLLIVSQLWNAHRSESGLRADLTALAVEVTVLNRPFFHPAHLLIARDGDTPLGFVHWMPAAEDAGEAVVANLAVPDHGGRDVTAHALLNAASEAAVAAGATRLVVGQSPEHWTGYAGVAVHGAGGGIPQADAAVLRWATEAGFAVSRTLLNYRLEMASFRPAYDRELLGLRRLVTVDHRLETADFPFRFASALSHLQHHRFTARERGGPSIAEVDLMLGDPEMLVVTSGVALLTRWTAIPATLDRPAPATRFVLASAIGELIRERITHIEATVDATDRASSELLQQAGFTLGQQGFLLANKIG